MSGEPERQWTKVEDSKPELWSWSKGTSSGTIQHRGIGRWHWEVTTYARPNDWDGTKWTASGDKASRSLAMHAADVALDHLFAGVDR